MVLLVANWMIYMGVLAAIGAAGGVTVGIIGARHFTRNAEHRRAEARNLRQQSEKTKEEASRLAGEAALLRSIGRGVNRD